MPTLISSKMRRYYVSCVLLIAHHEITDNDYLVMGTLDRPEWRKGCKIRCP